MVIPVGIPVAPIIISVPVPVRSIVVIVIWTTVVIGGADADTETRHTKVDSLSRSDTRDAQSRSADDAERRQPLRCCAHVALLFYSAFRGMISEVTRDGGVSFQENLTAATAKRAALSQTDTKHLTKIHGSLRPSSSGRRVSIGRTRQDGIASSCTAAIPTFD